LLGVGVTRRTLPRTTRGRSVKVVRVAEMGAERSAPTG
jgi:hypothetical protein